MMEFTGKRRWKASKADSWATVTRGQTCGKMVGTRLIDGVRVAVVKSDGRFYAERIAALPPIETLAAPQVEGEVKK